MRKRMGRLAALGIAAMLILGGCAKEEAPVIVETPEETVEEIEEVEEITEEEVVEEKIPLSVNITTNNKTYYFEDSEDAYLYLQYCDVAVEGDGYENLKRNLEKWSMERSEGLRSLYTSFEESAALDSAGEEAFYGYSLYQTLSTARVDEAVVCLLDDTYQYTGGAHGMSYREGVTFDAQSGKQLTLRDILTDYDNFSAEAAERIIYELKETHGEELFDDYITTVEEIWQEETEPEWYLDATGIVIVLQEYTVGPYTLGTPEIHLPYAEFEPYIKEAYLPVSTDGVAAFSANEEVFLQLPATGEEMPMMLSSEWENDMVSTSLWLGSQEMPLREHVVITNAYLLRRGEEVYCMIEVDMASDDYETTIYRLTDGVIEKVSQIGAAIDGGNINSDSVVMESWVYLLGTYGGVKTYQFDENGEFGTEDTEYVLHRNEFVLTTTTSIPVTLDGAESTLPAGSHIVINATDNETYVKFTIQETGQTGIMEVKRNETDYYNVTIGGMNENDCFEILPYAG